MGIFESIRITVAGPCGNPPQSLPASVQYPAPGIRNAPPRGWLQVSSPHFRKARCAEPRRAPGEPIRKRRGCANAPRAESRDIRDLLEPPGAAYSCDEYILLLHMSQ